MRTVNAGPRLARLAGPLRGREFRLLWAGQLVSALGDRMSTVALPFAVLGVSRRAADVGLVLAAAIAPRVALSLPGGVWADRLPRQRLMLASDLVRAAAQSATAALLLAGRATVPELAALAAVYGAANAFFDPAATGLVPETVEPASLQQANALMGLNRSVFAVVGPAVAGVLVATGGPGWAFAADAGTFAVSAITLWLLRVPSSPAPALGLLRDLRAGWREVRSRTWVWASILYFSLWNGAFAPLFVLGPIVARRSLGGPAAWGAVSAAGGIGAVAGGLVALRVRPARPLAAAYLTLTVTACELLALAVPAPTWLVAAAAVATFAATAFTNVLWFTTLQSNVPRAAISRVSAYDWMGSLAFQPAGFVAAGFLASALGVSGTLWAAAAAIAVLSALGLAVPGVRGVGAGTGVAQLGPPP